jgi:hypothetical protein
LFKCNHEGGVPYFSLLVEILFFGVNVDLVACFDLLIHAGVRVVVFDCTSLSGDFGCGWKVCFFLALDADVALCNSLALRVQIVHLDFRNWVRLWLIVPEAVSWVSSCK